MDRRTFLRHSLLATTALGVAGCLDDDNGGRLAPPPLTGSQPFPALAFLTSDPTMSDYRPAVNKAGDTVVFERTPFPNPGGAQDTLLYVARGVGSTSPTTSAFLPPPPLNPSSTYPFAQTRPDWSWANDQIAFNGAPKNASNEILVHIVPADLLSLSVVKDSLHHLYPTWTSDGTGLIVDNTSGEIVKGGSTTQLTSPGDGSVIYSNMNGKDAAGDAVWGGFASPKPGSNAGLFVIAYAGQPAIGNWGSGGATPAYNQDENYVFIGTGRNGVFSSAPLEAGASVTTYQPVHQGRTPSWSPDGNLLVFESSRAGGYALFLVNLAKGTTPQQLTEPTYWAQHAKFFASGTKIVFTALQQPSAAGDGPRGIATIDISGYL
jgi:hypothetical protein